MTQITYRDWILDCDVEATRAGYETISVGGAESCDCAGCRNFLAQRDSVYPAEVLNLFDWASTTNVTPKLTTRRGLNMGSIFTEAGFISSALL
jgi:hypothetical protein